MKNRRRKILIVLGAILPFGAYAQDIETLTVSGADVDSADVVAVAIDTLDTKDKFTKIVLFDDHTWDYIDMGRPVIDDERIFDESWNSDQIHAYKGTVELKDLPEEIDICLVDSIHGACSPVVGRISSQFKWRGKRAHKGTDIKLEVGDTVRAAFDGVVRVVADSKHAGGYGNLLVIRHSNGLETYYGHLSKFCVDTGEVVKAGECIALGGNTGRSTGPHLHFETRYMGQNFDPERLFDFTMGELRDSLITIKKHYFSIYSHYGQTDEQSKAASGRVIHKVKSGDTLGKIAKKYGTTVTNICKLNKISSKSTLRIGQRIIVR